jgi:hypothetical protein
MLHAIQKSFYWRSLKKIKLFTVLKNPYTNIRETRKFESIHEFPFVEQKNEGTKPDKKLESGKT